MLKIRLLGQFDVQLDKKRIIIPTRLGQSLLAYLALTAGTAHRREKLAGAFWPDTSDESARRNLRQELWRVRKALAAQPNSTADYLLADEFTVTFNRNSEYWLDVAQVERSEYDLESLSRNLAFYQGEFLPGFYEDWVTLERERLQSVFDSKMEQLLEQLIATEHWTAVQEQAERWLTLGNTPEPAFRALMLASGSRGDMAKVSSIFQRCIADLKDQFGVEPSAETRALYEGLLKGAKVPPRAQPSSTVTFLFTDIEGSTNLLDDLGDEYTAVLETHHALMRNAIQKWNGTEVDTQGDSFFVTFTRALDAVQCVAQMQSALQAHPWADHKAPRVRMGLHTGEPLIASTGYVGMDVHRAARIGDAAHGGQVLLSQTTRELVMHDLPKGLTIRDLGEHRLKDLKFPTPIFQLIIEGLPFDFPPVRTKFTGTEAPTPGTSPFKGLQYFEEVDADLFFGRELLTTKLMDRLRESRFLSVIIGASGSGKSSLVRAGLIPLIRNEQNKNWRIHILTPTAYPLSALATELTRDSESVTATATLMDDLMQDPRSLSLFLARQNHKQPILLVIDQFEELFTLCRDEFEREAFIDNLLTMLNQSNNSVTLVLTLRADFYAHLAQYPELRDAVAKYQEYIGPMTMDELRRAIEEPARLGHWEFEPGLVDLILRDVGDEPGALPLLSHALLETWKRRAGHTLTLKGYADAGGVHGAIAHTAEGVYQNLSADEQTIARNIFLRLTELGEGTEDTRRRASFNELLSDAQTANEVREVLNLLAEARLITLSEDSAEVAHEALIREWPTLREWLNQDREGLQLHRRLTEAVHEWEFLERDDGMLYRGIQLAQASAWAALHASSLNITEKMFLEASNTFEQNQIEEKEAQRQRELEAAQKLAETERQRAEEQTRAATSLRKRAYYLTGAFALALLMAGIALFLGDQVRQAAVTARANELIAFSRELAVQAKLNLTVDPERSILLALAGLERAHTKEVENVLHEAVSASRLRLTLRGHEGPIFQVDYSPNGKLIASAGDDKTARIWNAATGDELFVLQHDSPLTNLSFSPDGFRLATSTRDGLVRFWEVASGKELFTIRTATGEAGISFYTALAFSPDGKLLATSNDQESEVKFWDATSGVELFTFSDPGWLGVARGVDLIPEAIAFSPECVSVPKVTSENSSPGSEPCGTLLAINLHSNGQDLGRIEIWDVKTRQKIRTLDGTFDAFHFPAFSPDGKRLISPLGANGTAAVWAIGSGELLFNLQENLNTVRYSMDGQRLLAAASGGRIKVFDAETGEELLVLVGHTGRVYKLDESPSCTQPPAEPFEWCGKYLATAGDDGTIRIWDISPTGEQELLTVPGSDFSLNEQGTRISTVSYDIYGNADKKSIFIEQWDLPATPQSTQLKNYASSSIELGEDFRWHWFFLNDGILAAAFQNGPLKFWNVNEGGKAVYPISCCEWTERMVLSLSSRAEPRVAVGDPQMGTVKIWDLNADKEIQILQVAEPNELVSTANSPNSISLSPDGTRLVTLKSDATVDIWDVNSGQKLRSIPGPSVLGSSAVWFSPDGKRLTITDCTGLIVVRDAETGEEIRRFSSGAGCIQDVSFSLDGKQMATASRQRNLTVWDFETGQELLALPNSAAVQFSSDGTRLISVVDDTVQVYLLKLDDLIALARSRITRSLTTEECQEYLHMDMCP